MPKPKWMKNMKAPEERRELRYHFHKAMSGRRPGRSLGTTHASDVIDDDGWWCPRAVAIKVQHEIKPDPENITTAMKVAFQHGIQTADWLIDVLSQTECEVWGDWECRGCQNFYEFGPKPECCYGADIRYHEHRFVSGYSGISGGIDVMVKFPGDEKLTLVELKTMKADEFKELKAPIGKHKLRTNFYLRAAEEAGHADVIDTQKAKIFYVTKGGYGVKSDDAGAWGLDDGPWSPFKEFEVERDDTQTDKHSDLARRLHVWREEGGPLPEGICPTSVCPRAKKCNVRSQCWEGAGE